MSQVCRVDVATITVKRKHFYRVHVNCRHVADGGKSGWGLEV